LALFARGKTLELGGSAEERFPTPKRSSANGGYRELRSGDRVRCSIGTIAAVPIVAAIVAEIFPLGNFAGFVGSFPRRHALKVC
jgi:hypothetical protein